jgi:hypothetical protein
MDGVSLACHDARFASQAIFFNNIAESFFFFPVISSIFVPGFRPFD